MEVQEVSSIEETERQDQAEAEKPKDDVNSVLDKARREPSFQVGLEVFTDLPHHGRKVRCKTIVHGWYHKHFFIVDAPVAEHQMVRLKPNTVLTVRYVHDGMVQGFNTTFIRKVLGPTDLWFLSYPNVVEAMPLRKHTRLQTLIPVTVDDKDDIALIVDLSVGGAQLDVVSDEEFAEGKTLNLSFMLPNGERIEGLEADVKNVEDHGDSLKVGVKFNHEDEESPRLIDEFIESLPRRKAAQ